MSPKKASDALRDALASLPASGYDADRAMLGPLHQKVCAVVDELKAEGMKPEHVLLTVKRIARDTMIGPLGNFLVDKMVKWCLEQYFRESKAS